MNYIVVEPTIEQDEPVTRLEARAHLRQQGLVLPDDDDLDAKRAAARRFCEEYCERSFAKQTIEFAMDAFPEGAIELPLAPASEIVSVTYAGGAGPVVIAPGSFVIDSYSMPNWLVPAGYWPFSVDVVNAVVIRYKVNPPSVDALVKAAIKLMLGHLYANREATTDAAVQELPLGVSSLLQPFRVGLGV